MTILKDTKEYRIVELLQKAGYIAYFVGGVVRDYIIAQSEEQSDEVNFSYEDIDVATNASPEEVKSVLESEFYKFSFVGANFGVLLVDGVEVAQFRKEVYADDSKAKPTTSPAETVEADAIRRDFTLNALYMDLDGSIIDFSNGIEDIKTKRIRAIRSASECFYEDPSRILRMFYFAARFGFEIDQQTLDAAQKEKHLINKIPNALIGKITKKVMSYNVLSSYLLKLEEAGLFDVVYPEFNHTLNKPQNPKYHPYDVFNHTITVIKAAEKDYPNDFLKALKAWCHDIAKGLEGVRGYHDNGQPNDLGHEEAGFELAKKFCKRLEFGREVASEVGFTVLWHGIRMEPHFTKRSYQRIIRKLAEYCSNKQQLVERSKDLMEFMYLDLQGFSNELQYELSSNYEVVFPRFLEEIESTLIYISELPINGRDVIELMPEGYAHANVGKVLEHVLSRSPKNREEALDIASKHMKRHR